MAKKSTNTEETKQSTVVLNDEVNPIQDVENTPTPINAGDCSNPDHVCTCKPGHCPNKDCKSGHYWTEGTETDQYLYHYDSDDETIKLEDANHRKANPKYKVPEPPKDPEPSKPNPEPSKPGETKPNPGDSTQDPDQIPSNDCGPELEEPWAHDELLQDADGHTGLERELRLHCGVTYDVVKMWLAEIATATNKDAVIDKIAWHIPTGGPKSIKVHHKAKIVEALKALK
jgi:hypothetical protein